jgi:hypothetical protein
MRSNDQLWAPHRTAMRSHSALSIAVVRRRRHVAAASQMEPKLWQGAHPNSESRTEHSNSIGRSSSDTTGRSIIMPAQELVSRQQAGAGVCLF